MASPGTVAAPASNSVLVRGYRAGDSSANMQRSESHCIGAPDSADGSTDAAVVLGDAAAAVGSKAAVAAVASSARHGSSLPAAAKMTAIEELR